MKTWLIAIILASTVAVTVTIVSVLAFSGDDEDTEIIVNLDQGLNNSKDGQGCFNQTIDLDIIDDPWSIEPLVPKCYQEEPCDYSNQYWNRLACKCFNQFQCEIGCPSGQNVHPQLSCSCVDQAEIDALYPSCASQEDKNSAVDQGYSAALQRPEDWRICPRDNNFPESWCDGSGNWNELSCSCFSPFFCAMMCPIGEKLDPRYGCSCVDVYELRDMLYPSWATEYDIGLAYTEMYENSEYFRKLQVCPYWQDHEVCLDDFYWNELACECFSMAQCFAPCPAGQFDMPTKACGCTEDQQEYLDLFPEWANEKDIAQSISNGIFTDSKIQ